MPDRHGPLKSFTSATEGVSLNQFEKRQKDRVSDAIRSLDPDWLGSEGGGELPQYPGAVLVSKDLGDRPGFNAIQDAIDGTNPVNGGSGATDGDLIVVEPGTYEERPIIDDKSGLTVRGTNRSGVVIDGRDDAQFTNPYGFKVETDGISLESFTLKGPVQTAGEGYPASYFGFKITGCENFVATDITVEQSSLSQIDLTSVSGAELTDVVADGANENADSTGGTGIFLTNCEDVLLENVTTRNNNWGGIGISAWSDESYPTPNPTARGIRLQGSNTIEDSPILYTEEQPKELPYHTGKSRGVPNFTDDDERWDVSFPLNGVISSFTESAPHDVTDAQIDTGETTEEPSHTLIYYRSDPPQIAELYYIDSSSRDSAAARLEDEDDYSVLGLKNLADELRGELS
jgi:hypothetical protein